MTGNATFGDFWGRSAARLIPGRDQAAMPVSPGDAAATAAALQRLVSVIARYLDDEERWVNPEGRGPWSIALCEGRGAVRRAAACLEGWQADGLEAGYEEGTLAWDLAEAAGTLLLGRDLLQTHFTTRADGSRADLSDWARAVASPPVSRALLAVLAAHARAAAVRVSALPWPPGSSRYAAVTASRHLTAFGAAVQAAHVQAPVPDADLRLLEAIPVNAVPERQEPTGTEQTAELAAGVISAAERVRHGARDLASRGRWSPGMNATSMRQTAAACVVTSDSCEVILRSLMARAGELGNPDLRDYLAEVADKAAGARRTWLAAARGWDQMTTDSLGRMTPAAADALGMALWTGRLAYADPSWTPARGPSQEARAPGCLAPDHAGLATAVAAVHYASAAVQRLAEAGGEQIRTAESAGRLYVPTRSLPELQYDVPRRMADAPKSRVDEVLRLYSGAAEASAASSLAVAVAADMTGAPSRVLSAAAQAISRRGDATPPVELDVQTLSWLDMTRSGASRARRWPASRQLTNRSPARSIELELEP